MADSSNTTGASAPTAVLASLIGRLRSHQKIIRNAEARRTMGADMLRAADVIEHLLLDMPQNRAAAAAMVSYIGRAGYAAYTGGAR